MSVEVHLGENTRLEKRVWITIKKNIIPVSADFCLQSSPAVFLSGARGQSDVEI